MKKRTADKISTTIVAAYVVAIAFLVVFSKINMALKAYIAISTMVFYGVGFHIKELNDKIDKLNDELKQLQKRA